MGDKAGGRVKVLHGGHDGQHRMGGGSEGPRPITSVLNLYLFAELYAAIAPGDSRVLEGTGAGV